MPPLRLYRVRNRAGGSVWYVAQNPEQAKELALQHGTIRALENATHVVDQTDFYLGQPMGESLRALLHGDQVGVAVVCGRSISGEELLQRLRGVELPREPSSWKLAWTPHAVAEPVPA